MDAINYVKSSFDDKGYFIMQDAAFRTAGAIISGCFLRRFVSVHPPIEGAIYVFTQTVTAHLVNRVLGGKKNMKKSSLWRCVISITLGSKLAQRVIPPHLGRWTSISAHLFSSIVRALVLREKG